jgi:hypothetical protein
MTESVPEDDLKPDGAPVVDEADDDSVPEEASLEGVPAEELGEGGEGSAT